MHRVNECIRVRAVYTGKLYRVNFVVIAMMQCILITIKNRTGAIVGLLARQNVL